VVVIIYVGVSLTNTIYFLIHPSFMRYILPILALCLLAVTPFSAQTIVFSDDFESGIGNWNVEGAWGLTDVASNSPSNSLTDSPNGNYVANLNVSASLATPLDLSAFPDAEVSFAVIYDIEGGNFDFCFVEASSDGGATWVEIGRYLGQGNLSPWVNDTFSLAGFAGESAVDFRFRFFADGGFEVDGIYIDDVVVTGFDEDNGAPLVLHTPPTFYEGAEGDFPLIAQITDFSGIDTAFLTYTIGGSDEVVGGVEFQPGFYGFLVPGQAAGTQVDYAVTAVDGSTNLNEITTPTFSYIAGTHLINDDASVDFVNSFGPGSQGGLAGAAVRFTLANQTIATGLIRNYTDVNRPNSPMMFHIWDEENGLPGSDVITPFEITAEATLDDNSPMTRVDLSAFSAELSDLTGTYFMGFTVPAGETWVVQTTPGLFSSTYSFDGNTWSQETDDYHFRLVVETGEAIVDNDSCVVADDLSFLLGGPLDLAQNSAIYDNTTATSGDEPADGFDCFQDAASGPSLDNTQWFTMVGDGGTYEIRTGDCTAANPMPFSDSQIAVYTGDDCGNLTPIACNEDEDFPNDVYNALVTATLEEGVTYYMFVDGWNGTVGEYCVSITQINAITCDDAFVGVQTLEEEFVCFGDTVRISAPDDVAIPLDEGGPFSGYFVVLTAADISGSTTDPRLDPTYLGAYGTSSTPYSNSLINSGTPFAAGVYFFTPFVVGGAVDVDGTVANLDITNGCVIAGQSIAVTLLGANLPAIGVTMSSTDELDGGMDGTATATVTGGSGAGYNFLWDNGGTTQTITGLAAGEYTVTVSDVSDCGIADVIETVTVDFVSATNDPVLGAAITLFPNPAQDVVNLRYDFGQSLDLTVSLSNNLGQTVLTRRVSGTNAGSLQFDVSNLAAGVYQLRATDGKRQTIKPLVIK
jgi:hypothetical protein